MQDTTPTLPIPDMETDYASTVKGSRMNEEKQLKRTLCLYDPKVAQELNLNCACILERVRFLSEKANKSEGWFRCSLVKMSNDLGISKVQVKRGRDQLVVRGLIQVAGDGNAHFLKYTENQKREHFIPLADEENIPKGVQSIPEEWVQNEPLTDTKSTPERYKIAPTNNRDIRCLDKNEIIQTAVASKPVGLETVDEVIQTFRKKLPKYKTPRKLTKSQKLLLVKAKYNEEFSQFWERYRQVFNDKLKPMNITNSIGEKSKVLNAWCDRREEGLSVDEVAAAIKVFFLSELNMAARKKGNSPFCNRKLQNWLSDSENVQDALDSQEEAKQELLDQQEELAEALWSQWQVIETKYAHNPGSSEVLNSVRRSLAKEWVSYWNNCLEIHGTQFADKALKGPVSEGQYLVSPDLHEQWIPIVERLGKDEMQRWERSFLEFQSQALKNRSEYA